MVEQDLIINRALVTIFSHPVLSAQLAFRGGTALHKIRLSLPARYSEDIDLVQMVRSYRPDFRCRSRGLNAVSWQTAAETGGAIWRPILCDKLILTDLEKT